MHFLPPLPLTYKPPVENNDLTKWSEEIEDTVPAPQKAETNFLHWPQGWDSPYSNLMKIKERYPLLPAGTAPLQGTDTKNKIWPGFHSLWNPSAGHSQPLDWLYWLTGAPNFDALSPSPSPLLHHLLQSKWVIHRQLPDFVSALGEGWRHVLPTLEAE